MKNVFWSRPDDRQQKADFAAEFAIDLARFAITIVAGTFKLQEQLDCESLRSIGVMRLQCSAAFIFLTHIVGVACVHTPATVYYGSPANDKVYFNVYRAHQFVEKLHNENAASFGLLLDYCLRCVFFIFIEKVEASDFSRINMVTQMGPLCRRKKEKILLLCLILFTGLYFYG